jgi:hypothetical protein
MLSHFQEIFPLLQMHGRQPAPPRVALHSMIVHPAAASIQIWAKLRRRGMFPESPKGPQNNFPAGI